MSRPAYLKDMRRNVFLAAADDEKLDWQRVLDSMTGKADPLRFPVSYPSIDFDPATKKTILTGCLIIAGGIVLSGLARGAMSR